MDKISLECPKCGATMTLHPEKSEAVCDYCGHSIIIKKERSDSEKVRLAKEVSYAREKGHQQALDEAEAHRRKGKIKSFAIAIFVLALLISSSFLLTQLSKPEINPFDYVEITFSGSDGDGKASVNTLNGKDDTDVSDLLYEISPSNNLSEGDFVTVTVSSKNKKYRLTPSSKKYEVKGLQKYLTDINALDEEPIKTIYAENKELQEYNLSCAYSDVQFDTITPVQICLLTDNDKVSELFIVSEVTGKYENLSKKHYLVSEMDDVIASNGNISFGYSQYCGDPSGSVSENGRGFIYSYTSLDAAIAGIKSSNAALTYSEMTL